LISPSFRPGQHLIMVTGCSVRTGRIEEKDPAGASCPRCGSDRNGILLQQPFQHIGEARDVARVRSRTAGTWRLRAPSDPEPVERVSPPNSRAALAACQPKLQRRLAQRPLPRSATVMPDRFLAGPSPETARSVRPPPNDRGEKEETGRDPLDFEASRDGLLYEGAGELLPEVVRDVALPSDKAHTRRLVDKPGDLHKIADGIPVQPAAVVTMTR